MELEELHVFQRQAAAQEDGRAVAGIGIGVGCDRKDAAMPARGEDDRLGVEGVQFSGRQLDGHDARGPAVHEQQVEHLELVEEVDLVLQALLVEGLQDHMPGAVGGVAGAVHRLAGHVVGVPAKGPLRDLPFGRAVEREAHVLELEHGIDGLIAHELDGILIAEIIGALDRIIGVPLRLVFLQVAEGGADAALRGAGVGTRGVELADDSGLGVAGSVEARHQARASGPDDDNFKFVNSRHENSQDLVHGLHGVSRTILQKLTHIANG